VANKHQVSEPGNGNRRGENDGEGAERRDVEAGGGGGCEGGVGLAVHAVLVGVDDGWHFGDRSPWKQLVGERKCCS